MNNLSPTVQGICEYLAKSLTDVELTFNAEGRVQFEVGKTKLTFPHQSDAQTVEDIVSMWQLVRAYMDRVIDQKILAFTATNKKSFN